MNRIRYPNHFLSLPSRFLFLFVAGIIAVLSASLMSPAYAQGRVQVSIQPFATLQNGGQAAQVSVTVKCSPGNAEIIEAFIYVTQEGIQSNFTPLPVICRGGFNMYQLIVNTSNGEILEIGEAQASAYILIRHPNTGNVTSGQASETIQFQ